MSILSSLLHFLFEKSIWRFTKDHRNIIWLRVVYIRIVCSIVWIWVVEWSSSNWELWCTSLLFDILPLTLLRLYQLLLVMHIILSTYNFWYVITGLLATSISTSIKHLILCFTLRCIIRNHIFFTVVHWSKSLIYLLLLGSSSINHCCTYVLLLLHVFNEIIKNLHKFTICCEINYK